MSQFDEVSNMANPTLDAELAISMTVNAKLPKTPQLNEPAAGASDLAVDSLDNTIPNWKSENADGQCAECQDQMANNADCFKALQCKNDEGGCPKKRRAEQFLGDVVGRSDRPIPCTRDPW
jgi:hypothetical protein